MLRKLSTLFAVVAIGAVAGMIGQSLVANAGAPNSTTRSDKTIYAKANPAFGSSNTTSTGAAKTVLRITVHAPSAGQADIVVNTSMWTDYPASAGTTLFATQTFGRCGVPDSFASCANVTVYYFQKPANTIASDITVPYSLNAQLNFSAGGNRTLYLNAISAGYVGGLYAGAHVQVAFTPKHPISTTAHVTVAATP